MVTAQCTKQPLLRAGDHHVLGVLHAQCPAQVFFEVNVALCIKPVHVKQLLWDRLVKCNVAPRTHALGKFFQAYQTIGVQIQGLEILPVLPNLCDGKAKLVRNETHTLKLSLWHAGFFEERLRTSEKLESCWYRTLRNNLLRATVMTEVCSSQELTATLLAAIRHGTAGGLAAAPVMLFTPFSEGLAIQVVVATACTLYFVLILLEQAEEETARSQVQAAR
eukprot:CAMPEP_0172742522 /NCGR_PEP_ID=MMETSP1074-20121228/129725_1 /TAXON_ID=2916 /ORGANISM="Ceratium fusus, Strain PA161109" /LENGTH=220 /DNA_ID=CAMNT_0013573083 /DNA_START=227 /DNA_END=885 /DNA_ORIENTATION=+